VTSRTRPPVSARRPGPRWAAALVAGSLLSTAGCGGGVGQADPGAAAPASRSAAKETCHDVIWDPSPSLQVERTSRELVGFSPTLLGVHSTWTGDGFTAETVAGGYVDDLTEAYDDLHVTRSLTLEHGTEAELLRGRLLDTPILAVIWRDPSQEVPCDVHALVVTGADVGLEEELLRGLR